MNYLLKLASLIARPPGETRSLTKTEVVIKKKIIGSILVIAFLSFLFPLFVKLYEQFQVLEPDLPIAFESWRTVFSDSPEACPMEINVTSNCFANPSATGLWDSPLSRADKDHPTRVNDALGKVFWLGARIKNDDLKLAAAKSANYLRLGYINGEFDIWVNGKKYLSSPGDLGTLVSIILPFASLSTNDDLFVAIRIKHNKGSRSPDRLLGARYSGLSNLEHHLAHSNYYTLVGTIRPIVFATIEFLLSMLFLFLWLSAVQRQEYFYVFVLTLCYSFLNLLEGEFIRVYLPRDTTASIYFVCIFSNALFELVLGFAIARLRRNLFLYLLPIGIIFPLSVVIRQGSSAVLWYQTSLIIQYFLPVVDLLAASVCILQTIQCEALLGSTTSCKTRIRRLSLSAMIFLFLAAYYITSSNLIDGYWFSTLHLMLVSVMAGVVLMDYRDQELRVAKFSWSKHFNRDLMPVRGVVLRLDLIGSERLPTKRDRTSNYAAISSEIRLRFVDTMKRFGGFILFSEGDEIMAMYDDRDLRNSETSVWQTLMKLEEVASNIDQSLKEERRIPEVAKVRFRVSIVRGEIEPFVEVGLDGSEEPKWRDCANESGPLVLSKRILDLEKTIRATNDKSIVIATADLTTALESLNIISSQTWTQRLIVASNIKNQQYCVSTFELSHSNCNHEQSPRSA